LLRPIAGLTMTKAHEFQQVIFQLIMEPEEGLDFIDVR
jgi:hypothetical protein